MIDSQVVQVIKNLPAFKRTRFAPSPTGYLHLGHVLSAAYVWLCARLKGAEVVLRIEDHDTTRCRETYVASIYEDLEILGFHADLGRDPFDKTFRQTKHQSRYLQATAELDTYHCSCTRRQIIDRNSKTVIKQSDQVSAEALDSIGSLASLGHGTVVEEDFFYDRFCRSRSLSEGALRLRAPCMKTDFYDCFLQQNFSFSETQREDLLLCERNGNFSYQFSVVVDDIYEGIDMVIRGQDLLKSTGNQLLLHKLMGNAKPPLFFHHPLVTDRHGQKLSKRFFSESIQSMLQKGQSPGEILGKACWLGGLWPENSSVSLLELIDFYHLKINH